MAKKISKWFRIGVAGDTCDGRDISEQDIQDMADGFDPRVYGCRINLEHIRGIYPDSPFCRYGDVVEVKAEVIDDDSALNGKLALFGKIAPLDNLLALLAKGQKVYTSMEIRPNFANTGKCGLIGLAVTDDPASLGTEYLQFCSRAQQNPLAGKKDQPGDLFSVATFAALEFEDLPDTIITRLSDTVKGIFSRKQASDDARFNDVHEAVTAIAEQVQTGGESAETRFGQLESELADVKKALAEQATATTQQFSALTTTLENTESKTQGRRKLSTGGDGDAAGSTMTDC
ncbi:GPO family capsid scaffolding protein [Salmonella enterica subsp. enterica serovar Kiambu]|uniref:GPO family capsid scaffolding protein n=1 Tax=Salmonella enterica TaxID=28901 RepID=UPI00111F7D7A|nr:GPO family capsid scaffolding protein [Salmonella enterica]EBQ6170821.1 GPO family capsid scaffolding protein [Salmonella enterica subsp. enterica serovar Derby]EBU7035119.1 GPO family capsid scaffolding protein [Salmonella enterica subsp. enterica serovar Indiana]ELI7003273.1 GPO family capsid scaffolding protein [Citrobacter freundii]EAV5169635.1 GPO family capsid scaffolding protein [Salmonella enterica]EDT7921196.1 GPO family capsid scaffolding protein [Salmonella enterica subsp. enteri